MNYYNEMTADIEVSCSTEDHAKLSWAIKKNCSSMDARLHEGKLRLFNEENFNMDADMKSVAKIIGEIIGKAGLAYLGFGVSCYGSRPIMGSSGGYHFRVYADGTIVEPEAHWPENNTWVCKHCGHTTHHTYDDLVNCGEPMCPNEECDGHEIVMDRYDGGPVALPGNFCMAAETH